MRGPRTPLLRPRAYFASHDDRPPLRHAAVAVAVVAVVAAGGMAVFLGEFAAALDVPVEVDNPAHTDETVCETSAFTPTPSGCDSSVPETVERDLGAMVAEEFSWVPVAALVVVPAFWVVQAGVLHAGSAVVGGEGPFAGSLAVAGWGMVPGVARTVGVGAFVLHRLRATRVSGDPESAVAAVETAVAGLGSVSLVAAVVVAVWAGAVRVYGLAAARDIEVGAALGVVGATTLVGLVFELV